MLRLAATWSTARGQPSHHSMGSMELPRGDKAVMAFLTHSATLMQAKRLPMKLFEYRRLGGFVTVIRQR